MEIQQASQDTFKDVLGWETQREILVNETQGENNWTCVCPNGFPKGHYHAQNRLVQLNEGIKRTRT